MSAGGGGGEAVELDCGLCDHGAVGPIAFDPDAARGLTAREVRARWPRYEHTCAVCGTTMVAYASMQHYIAGDW